VEVSYDVPPRELFKAMQRSELLPTVCLCAIVKDEEINHSGGIRAYLERIVPHVRQAVVLDTGSSDRTVDILRQSSVEWPWLHVFQGPFNSFAEARNLSLRYCESVIAPECSHILILDADEYFDVSNLNALAVAVRQLGDYRCLDAPPTRPEQPEVEFNVVSLDDQSCDQSEDCDQTEDSDANIATSFVTDSSHAPCCLALQIQCVDAQDQLVHRPNSGLLNPRVFPITSRLRFVNSVGRRFERLMLLPASSTDSTTGTLLTADIMSRAQAIPPACIHRRLGRIEFRHAIAASTRQRARKNQLYHQLDH
jgi:hypothetical protein